VSKIMAPMPEMPAVEQHPTTPAPYETPSASTPSAAVYDGAEKPSITPKHGQGAAENNKKGGYAKSIVDGSPSVIQIQYDDDSEN
jgi:hypothetical protein